MFVYYSSSSICKALIINHHNTKRACTLSVLRFVRTQSSSDQTIQTQQQSQSHSQSLTVSYLANSCGLSIDSALSASKLITIKSTERPDSVLELLKSHGFSKNQITTIISRNPRLILSNPVKTLRPKFEFLESLGIVGPDLPKIVCSSVHLLGRSLERKIIPIFDFLKKYWNEENLVHALIGSSRIVSGDIQNIMGNVETLLAHGVDKSHIGKIIKMGSRSITARTDLFKEIANTVKDMGVDTKTLKFIMAIVSMSIMSKLTWEKKKLALMSFGWTESDFISAFKLQPMFIHTSEKKIREIMDFLVKQVGLEASDVAKCPNVFLLSLEKNIVPRYSVLQILKSKGLIDDSLELIWLFNYDKKRFEAKFVTTYKDIDPEVTKAYEGVIPLQGRPILC